MSNIDLQERNPRTLEISIIEGVAFITPIIQYPMNQWVKANVIHSDDMIELVFKVVVYWWRFQHIMAKYCLGN